MSETLARGFKLSGALATGVTVVAVGSTRSVWSLGAMVMVSGLLVLLAWRRSDVYRMRRSLTEVSEPVDELVRQALGIEQSSERQLERCRNAFIVCERSKDLGAADIWILGSQGARLPLEALRHAGCTTVASVLDADPREIRVATGISKADAMRVRSACDSLIRRNLAEYDGVPLLRPNSSVARALITALARRRFVIESVAGYALALAGTARTLEAECRRFIEPLTFGAWAQSLMSGDDVVVTEALAEAERFLESANGPRTTAVVDQARAYLNDVVATLGFIDEEEAVSEFFDDPTSMRELYRAPQQPLAMFPGQLAPEAPRRDWFGPRPGFAGLD